MKWLIEIKSGELRNTIDHLEFTVSRAFFLLLLKNRKIYSSSVLTKTLLGDCSITRKKLKIAFKRVCSVEHKHWHPDSNTETPSPTLDFINLDINSAIAYSRSLRQFIVRSVTDLDFHSKIFISSNLWVVCFLFWY